MGDTREERDASTRRQALKEIKAVVFEEMLKLFDTSHEDLYERMTAANIEFGMLSTKTIRRNNPRKNTGEHLAKTRFNIEENAIRIALIDVWVKCEYENSEIVKAENTSVSDRIIFLCFYEKKYREVSTVQPINVATGDGYFRCEDLTSYLIKKEELKYEERVEQGIAEHIKYMLQEEMKKKCVQLKSTLPEHFFIDHEYEVRDAIIHFLNEIQTKFSCVDTNRLVLVQSLFPQIAEKPEQLNVYLYKYDHKTKNRTFLVSATQQPNCFLVEQNNLPLTSIELILTNQKHGTLVRLNNSKVKIKDKFQMFSYEEAQQAVKGVIAECKEVAAYISGKDGKFYPSVKPQKQEKFEQEYNLKAEKSLEKSWEQEVGRAETISHSVLTSRQF